MCKPNVNDPNHAALQAKVKQLLSDRGYQVVDHHTYHESLPKGTQDLLIQSTSTLALSIRTMPDLIAFKDKITIPIEIKTNTGKHDNCAIEAWPIIQSILLSHRTHYVYQRLQNTPRVMIAEESRIPTPTKLILTRKSTLLSKRVENLAKLIWPDIKVQWQSTAGSDDPYLIWDAETIATLPTLDQKWS